MILQNVPVIFTYVICVGYQHLLDATHTRNTHMRNIPFFCSTWTNCFEQFLFYHLVGHYNLSYLIIVPSRMYTCNWYNVTVYLGCFSSASRHFSDLCEKWDRWKVALIAINSGYRLHDITLLLTFHCRISYTHTVYSVVVWDVRFLVSLSMYWNVLMVSWSMWLISDILSPNYDDSQHKYKFFEAREDKPLLLSCGISTPGNHKLKW